MPGLRSHAESCVVLTCHVRKDVVLDYRRERN
jgi:hypothetical protein